MLLLIVPIANCLRWTLTKIYEGVRYFGRGVKDYVAIPLKNAIVVINSFFDSASDVGRNIKYFILLPLGNAMVAIKNAFRDWVFTPIYNVLVFLIFVSIRNGVTSTTNTKQMCSPR